MLTLIGLLVAGRSAVATEPEAAVLAADQLWLSPRSCIPVDAEAPCVERLRLRWRASVTTPICIWQSGALEPLFCEQQAEGERELLLPIRASTRFDLLQQSSNTVLASAEILVLAKPDANKRRRYQHPWSIF